MRRILNGRVLAWALALLMILAGSASIAPLSQAYAADEYTYTVRIFAGEQGSFNGDDVLVYDNLTAGNVITFDANSVTLPDDSRYYVSGIRKSGVDNHDPNYPQKSAITVTGDEDYVVAYGVKSKIVAYTVKYVDENNAELLPPKTYYGNVGDKPAVAFEYFEGYVPQAYNLTKTLSENESDNVFTFKYAKGSSEEIVTIVYRNVNGNVVVNAVGGNANAANGTAIADNGTPTAAPQDTVDLDSNDVPMSNAANANDQSSNVWLWVFGAVLAAAAIAAAAVFLRRRNREGYEEE